MVRKSQPSSPKSPGNIASHGPTQVINSYNVLSNMAEEQGKTYQKNSDIAIPEEGELIETGSEEEDNSHNPSHALESATVQGQDHQSKIKTGQTKHRSRSRGPPKPLVNRKEKKLPKHTSSRK